MRFTTKDLDAFPDPIDGTRYEIIDGELYISKVPSFHHQQTCGEIAIELMKWSDRAGAGEAVMAPGVIFAEDETVAPDVVWASQARLNAILRDGYLYGAPELIAEVLSPGARHEFRDREAKLKLYSRRGVDEYWIVNYLFRTVEVYRRGDEHLTLTSWLKNSDALTSPLLPGFSVPVSKFFPDLPS